jgi:hypothetical protein
MKTIFLKFTLLTLLIVWGCGTKSHDHDMHDHEASEAVETKGNQALYDEVMKVHDEVMPKMNDIYKAKQELNAQLTNASEEKKKEIQGALVKLDSASESMMEWMHNFNPIPDSVGEEKAREYLETEMEKIKKVKEDVNEALEQVKKD